MSIIVGRCEWTCCVFRAPSELTSVSCMLRAYLGASVVWHLGMCYGDFLAAVVHMGGRIEWPGERGHTVHDFRDDVQHTLEQLPIRAYHIDTDQRAGTPERDMRWLEYYNTERTTTQWLPRMTRGNLVEATVWEWSRSITDATCEFWKAKGPL